jgi:hypothetical protein
MKFPIRLNKYTGSYLAMMLTLWDTKGMFFSGIPIGIIVISIMFFYWIRQIGRSREYMPVEQGIFTKDVLFLVGIQGVILLSGLFYETYDILHSDHVTRYSNVLHGFVAAFFVGMCYLIYAFVAKKEMVKILVALVVVAIVIQTFATFCSVVTGIDVTVMLQGACDYFIHGKNPYDARYPDIFNGFYVKYYGSINYMTYWPTVVYTGSIFYFLFGDYRYAYIFISIALALAIYKYREKVGLSKENALLFILLWVSNPVLSYTINRGWIDVFVTLPFFLFLHYLKDRKVLLSGLFLGIVFSVKLYYLLLTPFIGLYLLHHFGFKQTLYFVAVCGGIFAATIVPFLIIDAHQFYQSTINFYSGMKLARPDSLSWVSYITRWNLELVSEGTYFSLAVIAVLIVWFMFCEKTITRLIEFSSVALFIFFLCARQAFCNYYLFIMFLYYMGIYFSVERKDGASA